MVEVEVVMQVVVEMEMIMVVVMMEEVVVTSTEVVRVEEVMVMVEVVMLVLVEMKGVTEVRMVHSHLCSCSLDAPMGDQGPVAPSAGIEGALLCLLVNLHQEGLVIQFFILVG